MFCHTESQHFCVERVLHIAHVNTGTMHGNWEANYRLGNLVLGVLLDCDSVDLAWAKAQAPRWCSTSQRPFNPLRRMLCSLKLSMYMSVVQLHAESCTGAANMTRRDTCWQLVSIQATHFMLLMEHWRRWDAHLKLCKRLRALCARCWARQAGALLSAAWNTWRNTTLQAACSRCWQKQARMLLATAWLAWKTLTQRRCTQKQMQQCGLSPGACVAQ